MDAAVVVPDRRPVGGGGSQTAGVQWCAWLLVAASLFVASPRSAGAADNDPTVVLFTMGVGDMVVERFGHAALCLEFDEPKLDRCFNYGTTDFVDVGAMAWGLLRGSALYWQSTMTPDELMDVFTYADRTVWAQPLPLSRQQAKAVHDKLMFDSLPENTHYTYHHVSDNCSTRIRDLIDEVTDGALSKGNQNGPELTYRDVARKGLADNLILLLLTDLVLGRAVDERPTVYQGMFLPDLLRAEVSSRLRAPAEIVYERERPPPDSDPGGRWWLLVIALVLAGPIVVARRRAARDKVPMLVAFMPLGLLAVVLWAVAAVSLLPEFRLNEALLVLIPTDLAVPFLSASRRQGYARVRLAGLVVVSVLLAAGVFVQPLWAAISLVAVPMAAVVRK